VNLGVGAIVLSSIIDVMGAAVGRVACMYVVELLCVRLLGLRLEGDRSEYIDDQLVKFQLLLHQGGCAACTAHKQNV
jgi:hypothetical protein